MNDFFAIDPQGPQDKKDLATLAQTFGPNSGRFIAAYPTDWTDFARQVLNKLSGLDRARAELLLGKLLFALVPIDAPYSRGKSWEENAVKLVKQQHGLKEILGKDPNSVGLKTLTEFLWDTPDSLTGTSSGSFIPMTLQSYRDALWPLFALSTEVHLVDRFFTLRKQDGLKDHTREPVLRLIIQLAKHFGRTKTLHIHFHRDLKISEKQQEQRIESDLLVLADKTADVSIDILYSLLDETSIRNPRLTHGRYIFSMKGGLQFDHGFQILSHRMNHVHWLTSEELNPLLAFYSTY